MSYRQQWAYPGGDPSILLFDHVVREWPMDLPKGARVLELGCCETDFHQWLLTADPSLKLTGVDVNECPSYTGTFIRGDATNLHQVRFEHSSFEAVILLGALEHFGLGFYGDTLNPYGDMAAMRRVADWLVPGGWCYYDVPWTPHVGAHHVVENRHYRVYDDATLTNLDGHGLLKPLRRAYANGQTNERSDIRPSTPMVPYWYVQRLVEKPA